MSIGTVRQFESSLSELGVHLRRTDAADFVVTIDEVVTEPAVGVPFETDEFSLEETVVETPPTPRRLKTAETGVTPARAAIGKYGTLVLESDAAGTEPVSLYPPSHVAVVCESDVVTDIESISEYLADHFATGGSAIFATGVSSTGDMGALVEGVHGPKYVTVVLVTDR